MRILLVMVLLLPRATSLPAQSTAADTHTSHTSGAAGRATIAAFRVDDAMRVDGRLDEDAWARAQVASDFVQQSPQPGEPTTFRTEARVLIDGEAVYVGLRMYDSASDSIVAQLARRDVAVHSDWVYVAFDSYGDRRTAFQFGVNAAGVKRDSRIADDTREDAAWDAVWDVAATIDAEGWVAEFRIPLSQLRYRANRDEPWGFNVKRVVARSSEVSFWSPVPNSSGTYVSSFGQLTGMLIDRSPRRAELTPYVASRVLREPATNPGARRVAMDIGADTRLSIGSALTFSGTVNPDFGQIEADPSLVNLTTFEPFQPERRPFFVEGAEFFRTSGPTLFYSRRIGRAPQGRAAEGVVLQMPERATLLGAGKLTGRAGAWSVGLMDAVTAGEHARVRSAGAEHAALVEPATNYLASQVSRDFRNGRSAVGAIATSVHRMIPRDQLTELRREAYAGGLDVRHRFSGDRFEVSAGAYGSYVAGDTAAIARTQRAAGHFFQRPDADHLDYDPARTSLTGFALNTRLAKVAGGNWRTGLATTVTTPAFEVNDLGFHSTSDRIEQNAWVSYLQHQPGRFHRRWSAALFTYTEHTLGRERIERNAGLELAGTTHTEWSLYLFGMRHAAGLRTEALRGGPALFQPGRWMYSVELGSDSRRAASATVGLFFDKLDHGEGDRLNAYSTLQFRPSPRTDVRLRPSVGRYHHATQYVGTRQVDGTPVYLLGAIDQTTAAVEIRASYTFSAVTSLELYAQPFLSAGEYSDFKRASSPSSARPGERYIRFQQGTVTRSVDSLGVVAFAADQDGDGVADIRWTDPSFNFKQVRSNAVFRWEFRPGSTLFVVWSQERTDDEPHGRFDGWRDVTRLLRSPGRNVLSIKATYWLGL